MTPRFDVIDGAAVRTALDGAHQSVVDLVRETYLRHHDGRTVNPASYFLRFPDRPEARIIALPAAIDGEHGVAGLKWIASFPRNVEENLQRASAVLLLNERRTGYPYACIEAAQISAARTAASAVLAAETLAGGRRAGAVTIVGAGVIARTIVDYLQSLRWQVGQYVVHDVMDEYAARLAEHIASRGDRVRSTGDLGDAIDAGDMVVFATTAAVPYVEQPGTFRPGQIVLNVSLRDIGPDLIAASHNILDDIEHCLKANTSPHLTEQRLGHRRFIDGTFAQLIRGEIALTAGKPWIFSPFGLGVLDLALGRYVYDTVLSRGATHRIPGFFDDVERWAGPATVW
jgi:2,3-diaminopropionate biosynthesis protein SbnB